MQWVKDPLLPRLWCRFQLRCGFDPWPPNFPMPQVWLKKKKIPKETKTYKITVNQLFGDIK